MKTTMIAALAAAQLTAAAATPALAAETPPRQPSAQQDRFDRGAEDRLAETRPLAEERAEAAPDKEVREKKRKSTGDKVLTGVAVVLGIGALAVGGLLVAIFVG